MRLAVFGFDPTPNRRAHRIGVGFADRLIDVVIADDRQRRTELLLVDQAAAAVDVGDERDRIEIPGSPSGIAAEQNPPALRLRLLDEA